MKAKAAQVEFEVSGYPVMPEMMSEYVNIVVAAVACLVVAVHMLPAGFRDAFGR